MSRALSGAGLRFYKSANRTTFVSASRSRHLNLEETPVSDSIRKIIEAIRGRKSIRRSQLLDLLVPASAPAPVPPAEPVPPASANPARDAVINDLLWLTHEGYVIEYADGRLESVPMPKNLPKPAGDQPAAAEVAVEVVSAAEAPAVLAPAACTEDQAPADS